MGNTRRTPATSSTPRTRRYVARPAASEAPIPVATGPLEGSRVVFTDIGDILGQPVFTTDPPPPQLARLDVFPFVRHVLDGLRSDGLRLGIISNTGDEPKSRIDAVLKAAGLLDLFDAALLVYSSDVGMTKDSPKIFRLAAAASRARRPTRTSACSSARTRASAVSRPRPDSAWPAT